MECMKVVTRETIERSRDAGLRTNLYHKKLSALRFTHDFTTRHVPRIDAYPDIARIAPQINRVVDCVVIVVVAIAIVRETARV